MLLGDDLKRSTIEVSDGVYRFIKRNFPDYEKYLIPCDMVKKLLPNDVINCIDKFHYTREIGGEEHEKVMIGTITKFDKNSSWFFFQNLL